MIVKSGQRQYIKKHGQRKESNVKKTVEDLTCKHTYEQAVSFKHRNRIKE